MSIISEEVLTGSPYLEKVERGRTVGDGSVIRPAECHWHLVLSRHNGKVELLVVGPWSESGVVTFAAGAELLWIKLKLGVFMPHLPTRDILNSENALPDASSRSFWLKGSAWQFPDHENVETFIDGLVRQEILVCDPLVEAVLQDCPQELSPRTVRHRFLQSTGLSQNHIRQVQRAFHAQALLERGFSILDTVYEAGYYDQAHLTRALKQYTGYTPAQIVRSLKPENCHFIQDNLLFPSYHTNVLENI